MRFLPRLLVLAAALGLLPSGALARVNLGSLGLGSQTGIGLDWDITEPPPPGGGGPSYTVSGLESEGYLCTPGGAADIVCTGCGFIEQDETQICTVHLCKSYGTCTDRRTRWGVPRDVDPADFGMWAREFALGADPYWVGDFNGDSRRDLAGRLGPSVHALLSTGTHFDDVGAFSGPTPVESAGPSLLADVNRDGISDHLSVSSAGHLVVGISTGSSIAATVELPNTWCEGVGDCLIGDVNGDGMPDLLEVLRGAIDGHRPGDVWVSLARNVPGFPSVPSTPVPPDTDGDGVRDNADNCLDAANPSQLDSNGDLIGNACDADLNGDAIVNQADAELWVACFGAAVSARPECAASDFDGDGNVSLADAATLQAALGKPPGRAAANQAPAIELFTPEDGTILPAGAKQAWVAGWVPNLPAGGVQVRVGGQSVPVSGDSNYFAAFVDLPTTDPAGRPKVFHGIVVEAERGTRRNVVRRAVVVGEHAAPNRRAHEALGARLTAAGLERIEQYAREVLIPEIIASVPESINGYSSDLDCVESGPITWPVCTTGNTISNAQIGMPDVSVDFQSNGVQVFASIPFLELDLTVHGTGPTPASWSCGGHVSVTDIEATLLYGFAVGGAGRVEVVEKQEPVVTANVSYDNCGEDDVKAQVKAKLVSFLNDPDDVNGASHGIYQKSPIGKAVEDLFASFDLSGTYTEDVDEPVLTQQMALFRPGPVGTTIFDPDPLSLAYDARFELVTQDASGISLWLGAAIDAVEPKPGLGGPQGAYQIPGFAAPALPSQLVSGNPFDVAAAVTPNGLNELLDALTRAGVLAAQRKVITKIANPLGEGELDLTAGILALAIDAFQSYPPFERFRVEVTPPTFAPVVTGRRGPKNEAVDLHVSQLGIRFVDESGHAALALRADVRVGVDIGFGGSGTGELSAFAKGFEVLSFAVIENPVGADPAQVALRVFCSPAVPDDVFGCAMKDQLMTGLDTALGPIELPSISDGEDGFALTPKCLQRLGDGSFVAEYDLLLPGEAGPSGGFPSQAIAFECIAPPTTGGATDGGGLGGSLGGHVGTIGGVLTTATALSPAPATTASSPSLVRPLAR